MDDAPRARPVRPEFTKGLWRENPVFIGLLGLCPAMAVTNSLTNALVMGFAAASSSWGRARWCRRRAGTRLSKQIASIHSVDIAYASANPSIASSVQANLNTADNTVRRGTGTTLEPKGNIRCSYCHDVHDLNRASNPFGAGKETWTGRPFLRGSWFGSPYPPDMPPRTGYTYPTTGGTRNLGNRYVTQMTAGMPRVYADVNSRNRGGYFIDLNSGNSTASSPYNALDNTAGLCTLCHGGSVAGDVDKMNFYAASLWRADQVNGHSNAVQGGTGSNKRDLFNANRGTKASKHAVCQS